MSKSVTASSLIVVSNRLPFVLHRNADDTLERKSSAGGLVTAVAPVVVQSGGEEQLSYSAPLTLTKVISREYVPNSKMDMPPKQNKTANHILRPVPCIFNIFF
jgi:trehalose-6-phosphate synthase